MSHLLISFREFAEALLLVNTLTERRILELKHSLHQEHLSSTLQNLKKCVPMLYTAIQSDMMHPQNEQIIASRLYIFDLAVKTVQELRLMLTNGTIKQEQLKAEGTFSRQMSNLLQILNNPNPTHLHNSDLDFLVGGIIFYSMFVADCSRPVIKLRLVKHCQQLLELRKDVSDQLNDCLPEGLCPRTMQRKLEQISNKMKVEMVNLNQTLVSAIFCQFLDAFTGSHDPLKRLLKSIMKNNKKSGFQSQSLFGSKTLPLLLQTFQNHTDKLLKIAGLVLAKCPNDSIIKEIQNSTNILCTVRDAVICFILDNKINYETKFFEKAQSIYQRWTQATESLLASLDGIVTVHKFLDLCIHEIEDKIHGCEKSFRRKESEAFRNQADDICSLTKHIVQFTNRYIDQSKDPFNQEVIAKGDLSMDKLIQTAIFVSHHLEEIKNCLIVSANYWYTFSSQLFCSSAKVDIPCNMEIFSRTMQSLASIVQLINQILNIGQGDHTRGAVSGKHEHVAKIQVQMTKAQIRSNQLLCKARFLSDKSNLEHSCLEWSITVQHLLKHVDDFIQFDSLFMSEPRGLTKKNISGSKTFIQLCETSLWLEEAAALFINTCMEGNAKNNIGSLKEALGSLRESILKIRDDLNSSTNPAACLLVDYALIQREVAMKMQLLAYHIRNNYKRKCGSVQSLVDFVVSAASIQGNEDKVTTVTFAQDSRLLVENMKLVKESVKTALHAKSEESTFLVEHLTFLTSDIVTRAGELLEHRQQWESFRLEVMSLNWTAKAQQLILQLQSDAQLDAATVTFVRQCLQINSEPEYPVASMLTSLKNEKQNCASVISANTDIMTPPAVLEESGKASSNKASNINWGLINTLYEETTVCGKTNDYILSIMDEKNITTEAGLKGTQYNEAKTKNLIQEKVKDSKVFKVQQENDNEKPFQASSSQKEQTVNKKSEKYVTEGQQCEVDKEQSQNIPVVVDGEQQYSANDKLCVAPKQCQETVDNKMMEASPCDEQPIKVPKKLQNTAANEIFPESRDENPQDQFHESKTKMNDIKSESVKRKPQVACSERIKIPAILAPKKWQGSTANTILPETDNKRLQPKCNEQKIKMTINAADQKSQGSVENKILLEPGTGQKIKSSATLKPKQTDRHKLQPLSPCILLFILSIEVCFLLDLHPYSCPKQFSQTSPPLDLRSFL
ncbi:hypothetical protein XELAEV_18026593mg [Xenopus laevis]|uniref:Uncharacterized protein n=1 Tax=Xenopus laevis TaxID=8355 RepID=A0A974CW02_XENLA|nr:hypothetical protein XELAEV_18026593mg [Xenopus laevis]